MNNNQQILTEFDKNGYEIVRISAIEYHSNKYVDVRIWILADQSDEDNRLPTKKGLRLHVEMLPDLIKSLQKAKSLIRKSFDKSSKKKN